MYFPFKPLSAFTTFIVIIGALLIINGSVVPQADAQVMLTEVDYHNDVIEIVNMGASTVDISNWVLCSLFTYPSISSLTVVEGSTNLEPGGIVVLSGFALNDAGADLGLYDSRNFTSPAAMQSFVQWGSGGNGRESVAVQKGIWAAGEFVPAVAAGNSIEYSGVGSSAAAWFDQAAPNFGVFGEEEAVFGVALELVGEDALSTNDAVAGVTYTLSVTNTGNQDDTISLAADPEVGIEGMVLGSLSEAAVALGAGESAELTLNVAGDAFTEPGDYEVKVIATSAGDASATNEVTTTTTIEIATPSAVFGVTLEIVDEDALSTNDAITGVTYTLSVTNTGDQADTIDLVADPEVGGDGTVLGILSDKSVSLGAGESIEIALNVIGAAFTEPGDYEVKVIATSAGDASATDEVTTTTTIEIEPPTPGVFGVTLEIVGEDELSTNDAIVGVAYTLNVTNTGDQADTIDLAADPEVGGDGTVLGILSDRSIELGAGESVEITLNVIGAVFTPPGDYEVKVIVTSVGDSSATAEVTATTTIEIGAPELPPWDVDESGSVDVFDLVLVAGQFGLSGEDLDGDIDGNGTVDVFDLVTVASHFGESTTLGAPAAGLTELTAEDQVLLTKLLDALERHEDVAGLTKAKRLLQTLLQQMRIPEQTQLLPNFPNPFNPETWLPYQLAEATGVTISIYDARGRAVHQFELGHQSAGSYTSRERALYWDGRDSAGEPVSSGLYFYTLKTDAVTQTRRMVIVK
ncbi:MAG: T9SS type A sorting domain-containing protein [Candidatus Poribacteria bacterium]|nr:T9SS type A sorting domain-containing protein [Candidatus Poribacteria bacterium]